MVESKQQQQTTVAIPFITYDPVARAFHVTPQAKEFLSTLPSRQIGIISVCGKYRTGKSYLLNKLFLEKMQARKHEIRGFPVGPSIQPCTKGLWLWQEIFYSVTDVEKETPIIIIDTEGLGAFDEDENHDTKIFLLALLLCSLLVFNSVGSIDENALTNLSLVINLSKQLQVKQGQHIEDAEEISQYFPTFFWVLRDFALQLVDTHGNQITQKEYLEQSLRDQRGTSDAAEKKNRIRRLVRNFFPDRDCFTLVRPCEDEALLQQLASVNETQLRQEFNVQIDSLRSKILRKVKPKMLKGKTVSGSMLIELAESYISAINTGNVPTIDTAWQNVQKTELERAFQLAIKVFNVEPAQSNTQSIEQNLREQKHAAIQKFNQEIIQGLSQEPIGIQYLMRLKQEIKKMQNQVLDRNKQIKSKQITEIIQHYVDKVIKPAIQQTNFTITDLVSHLRTLQTDLATQFTPEQISTKILDTSLSLTQSFFAEYDRNHKMQIVLTAEQVKLTSEELQNVKLELKNERNELRDARYQLDTLKIQKNQEHQNLLIKYEALEQKQIQVVIDLSGQQKLEQQVKLLEQENHFQKRELTQTNQQLKQRDSDLEFAQQRIAELKQRKRELNTKLKITAQPSKKDFIEEEEFSPLISPSQSLASNISKESEKMADLEASNQILRSYKTIYQNASQITCSTCEKTLKPVVFKGHLPQCCQGLKSKGSLQIKIIQMTEQTISALVNYCGVTWQVEFLFDAFIGMVHNVVEKCPNMSLFASRSRFMQSLSQIENGVQDQIGGMNLIQSMFDQMSQFESLKQDREFRRLLRVNQTLEEPVRDSFFKQAASM